MAKREEGVRRMSFGGPRKPTGYADIKRGGALVSVPIYDSLTTGTHVQVQRTLEKLSEPIPDGLSVEEQDALNRERLTDYICAAAPDMPREHVEALHLRDLGELGRFVRECTSQASERDEPEEDGSGPPLPEAASDGTA